MKSKTHEYQNKYISMCKNRITILITFLITALSFAQQGINYKAILKDGSGNVLANTFMNVQFTIHQATAAGTIIYQEDHNYTTNTNGLVILTIGTDNSPSVGTFATIDWSADLHFLQTTITYSSGTINFDATEFMAVPYAKHAKTAETAANVFSGSFNSLTNVPSHIYGSGLRRITENGNTGWRLFEEFEYWHGDIGRDAIDLTVSSTSGSPIGATGRNSFSAGRDTTAPSYSETVLGANNTDYTPNSVTVWSNNDRLFVIGNGYNRNNKNDALIIYKNGNAKFDAEIQRTPTGDANLIPIAYGTIESNGNVLSGTGNFTASINANVITISVNSETLNVSDTSCLVTPYSTAFRTSSIIISGGDIQVRTFNSSGSLAPTTFQFVIYKL